MNETISNSISSTPEILYGLHFVDGVAEYRPPDADPFRVFVSCDTIKSMDKSFAGKPVYVGHVEGKENLNEADGWVVESFYCKADGRHWVKFVAVSDKAKDAIRRGDKLSNAYTPKSFGSSGLWNGVEFQKEIISGVYDHLAIVPDPRYAESIVLTPEEFKNYCAEKETELAMVANSLEKGEVKMAFWKKQKLENSVDLESTMVDLPKSKTQCDLKTLVNEMDEYRLAMPLPKMANDDDEVDMGEGKKMKVGALKQAYCDSMKAKNDAEAEERAAAEHEKKEEKPEVGEPAKEKAKNESSEESERKSVEEEKKAEVHAGDVKNAEEEEKKKKEEKKMNELKLFNELKNAHLSPIKDERTPDLGSDRLDRGKTRYGSGN